MGWLGKRSERKARDALVAAIGDFELPQFPAVILEAMRVIRDDESSVEAIADSLRADPGLSIRVLGLVNAPGFGLRHPVDDLPHAVQLMGRAPLESTLISLGTRQAVPPGDQSRSEQASFWRTAARRAAVASRIASAACPSESARLFTAALLQDMALPLLMQRHSAEYAEIQEAVDEGEGPLHALERERFGWDHAEVAHMMCDAWELPPGLGEAVGAHHLSAVDAGAELLPLVLSALLGDDDEEPEAAKLVEAAGELEALDAEQLAALVEEGLRDAEDVTRLLG